jgi:hypothetical protein
MKKIAFAAGLLALASGNGAQAAINPPVVVELFTSQGCSSCPPAEALLVKLANDPTIVPLTLHVDYWDYLGWKDPYSSAENTERQRRYSSYLGRNNVFTPQVMVDGRYSAVGSNMSEVNAAIAKARAQAHAGITITPAAGGKTLSVQIAQADAGLASPAVVLAFRFARQTSTPVKAGENRGETLNTVNSVTSISRLGTWQNKAASYEVPAPANTGEGVAVVIQNQQNGQILASAIQ